MQHNVFIYWFLRDLTQWDELLKDKTIFNEHYNFCLDFPSYEVHLNPKFWPNIFWILWFIACIFVSIVRQANFFSLAPCYLMLWLTLLCFSQLLHKRHDFRRRMLMSLDDNLAETYVGLHVKCLILLSDFKQTTIFSTKFRIVYTNIGFHNRLSSGTDRRDELNANISLFVTRMNTESMLTRRRSSRYYAAKLANFVCVCVFVCSTLTFATLD